MLKNFRGHHCFRIIPNSPNVWSVSPLSERLEELWVVCGFICRKWSYAIGGSMVMIPRKPSRRGKEMIRTHPNQSLDT